MILEVFPCDLTTSPPALLVATAGLWEALPRLCQGELAVARLLLVADTLEKERVFEAFQRVATPEEALPPGVLAYRIEYENYLKRMVQSVRYIRAYLVIHAVLEADGMVGLLGAYGLRARPLDHELPRPFEVAHSGWDHLKSESGRLYGLLASTADQGQAVLHARALHNLFAQDFPLYAALQFHTWSQAEVMRLLNQKAMMAKYGTGKTVDSIREAEQAQAGVQAISDAISNGEALHTFRLHVLVPGADRRELENRLEIVRGALPLRMERVYAPEKIVPKLFSAEVFPETDGTPLTTGGFGALLPPPHGDARRDAGD